MVSNSASKKFPGPKISVLQTQTNFNRGLTWRGAPQNHGTKRMIFSPTRHSCLHTAKIGWRHHNAKVAEGHEPWIPPKKKINEVVITLKGDHYIPFQKARMIHSKQHFFRGPGYVSFREGITEYLEFTLKGQFGWKSEGWPRHVWFPTYFSKGFAHRGRKRSTISSCLCCQ